MKEKSVDCDGCLKNNTDLCEPDLFEFGSESLGFHTECHNQQTTTAEQDQEMDKFMNGSNLEIPEDREQTKTAYGKREY